MSAQDQLIAKYGLPGPDYIHNYCMIWEVQQDFTWFPAKRFLVNIDFKDLLFTLLTNLQTAGLHTEIKTFDGCYNDRPVRGRTKKSLHAWSVAIDLNASLNPMVVNPTPQQRLGAWTQAFVDAVIAAGIFFGGNFKTRADPMHIALLDG